MLVRSRPISVGCHNPMPMRVCRTAIIVTLVASSTLLARQSKPAVSLIIANARIFTGVPAAPWADAVAITGDRIGAVGTTGDVRELATSETRVIDAAGRLVIPGINDAHVHIGVRPPGTSLEGPPAVEEDPSLDEVLVRLKAAAAKRRRSRGSSDRSGRGCSKIRRRPASHSTALPLNISSC
jgi:imidazolonepropionase-like amidohydrolase